MPSGLARILVPIAAFVAALQAAAAPETGAARVPAAAELLARNLEARGGAERWNAVRTLEIRGSFDAWSSPVPFTILRARPDRYRFEHTMLGHPMTLAWDGSRAWVASDMFGAPTGALIEESWKRNVIEDTAFISRLQSLGAAGVPIEVTGPTEVEGVSAWRLHAKPVDAPEETWYLDARTALEIKREAMIFDVFSGSIDIPVEVFYMDFREAEGLKLPFREERHFGTRYHLWVVDSVRANPALADSLFVMPPEPEAPPEAATEATEAK